MIPQVEAAVSRRVKEALFRHRKGLKQPLAEAAELLRASKSRVAQRAALDAAADACAGRRGCRSKLCCLGARRGASGALGARRGRDVAKKRKAR